MKLKYLNKWNDHQNTDAFSDLAWMKNSSKKIPEIHYIHQYKWAIDVIVNTPISDVEFDQYTLPLLFLMRHYIEITLKYLKLFFEYFCQEENFDLGKVYKSLQEKGHDLEKLYSSVLHSFNTFKKKYDNELEKNIWCFHNTLQDEKFINCENICKKDQTFKFFVLLKDFKELFQTIDLSATSFKYSTNKQMDNNLEKVSKINIEVLYCYLEQIDMVISYIEDEYYYNLISNEE